jgi:hypothetical protein
MKSSFRFWLIAGLAVVWIVYASMPAFADTYHTANFSGSIAPGNANVKAPFDAIISQSGPVVGSFVYDDQLIPAPGSGFVNVFFANFPDIGQIPAATAFTIDLGAPELTFTFADALPGDPPGIIPSSAAIQYNNGVFNGFFFVADFIYQGNPYRFDDEGGSWSIKLLDQIGGSPVPLTSAKVSGTLNFSLTNVQPYTPVPAPATLLLLGSGLVGLIGLRKNFSQS